MSRLFVLLLLAGCGTSETPPPAEAPVPPPVEAPAAPDPVAPTRRGTNPYARPLDAAEQEVLDTLVGVVRAHGLDVGNPWAVGHALLALGPDATLSDGSYAVDAVFARWAQVEEVGGTPLLGFPKSAGGRPIEPHSELFLQKLVDVGLPPDRPVNVQGRALTLADLWRGTLYRVWVDGDRMSVASWNDLPWALHGIAAWAPPGTAWVADGGHRMTLDGLTDAVVAKLVDETEFLARAKATGGSFQKRRQGIFAYTCGGAHLLQGAGYAVARGFGSPQGRATMEAQARLQAWRFPRELEQVDAVFEQAPEHALILAVQRLKMTGHHLETMTRFAALGLVPAGDAEIAASIEDGRREVVASVQLLRQLGAFERVAAIRAEREQTFLDLVGDGAHAAHALELAAGTDAVAY